MQAISIILVYFVKFSFNGIDIYLNVLFIKTIYPSLETIIYDGDGLIWQVRSAANIGQEITLRHL